MAMRTVRPLAGCPAVVLALLVVLVAASATVLAPPLSDLRPALPSASGPEPMPAAAVRPIEVAPAFAPAPSDTPLGPLPDGTWLTVAVGLAPQDPVGLATYLQLEYARGSPTPDRFLSTAVLAERYGAGPDSLRAAQAYFAGQGLRVTTSPDHLLLFVAGPSNAIARAFGTRFDTYRSSGGGEFFSHPTAAELPGNIPWTGVLGLANSTPVVPEVPTGPPAPLAGPAAGCARTAAGLAPCQVWAAYDLDPLLANGTNGSGYRIGVVDAYSAAEGQDDLTGDLATFATSFDLPRGNVHFLYPVPGPADLNASGTNPDWDAEDALDLEWARASAPNATIDFTFSPNGGIGLYEAVDWLVAHQAVNVLSMSWGEPDVGVFNAYSGPCASACNASTDGSYAILSPVLQFAAAEGISVFAATGDCGAADGTSGVATNFPASDPAVTGVGATVLNVTPSGSYLSEEGWSGNQSGAASPGCQNQGGSGGGYAPFPRPWWQTGLPASPGTRGVPDVSAVGGTPATIILRSELVGVLGTSLATPIWAGFTADLDQHAGQPLGFLDPALYRILHSPAYLSDFHDIVSGSNGYAAGPGWDPVTGLGTPIVANLSESLTAAPMLPANGLVANLTASALSEDVPLPVTFTVHAAGGSGSYPIEGVYFGDGTAGFATGGTAAHSYTLPGVYSAQAYVIDSSGNLTVSAPVLILVGDGGVLVVAFTASNTTPAVLAPVTFTAAASGGTTPYHYAFFFGDGTFANNSSAASVGHAYALAGSYCVSVIVWDSGEPTAGGMGASLGVGVGGAPAPTCRAPSVPLILSGGPSAESGTSPFTVRFAANVSGGTGGPYGYAWNFGDGAIGRNASTTHTFERAGHFAVELEVADTAGHLANETWYVNVSAPSSPAEIPILLYFALGLGAGIAVGLVLAIRTRRRPPPGPPPAVAGGNAPPPPPPPPPPTP